MGGDDNISSMRWTSRRGTLEPAHFREKMNLEVEMKPLQNSSELQKRLVKGDNAIKPLTDTFPMANNGCATFYGLPGTGKTTGILTAIQIIMDHIPHIQFEEGSEIDTGEKELEEYFNNQDLIAFNEGDKELPLLVCYVASPTAGYDAKYDDLGVPIIQADDLDELCQNISTDIGMFDRWWRTGRLLYELLSIVQRSSGDVSEILKGFKKVFISRRDMRAPEYLKNNYNVSVLTDFFKQILANDYIMEGYDEMYNSLSKGQKARFIFLPERHTNFRDELGYTRDPKPVIEAELRRAHEANQKEGVTIHSPFYEEHFVSIRPRSFLIVDDHAGEDYVHKSNTAFTRLIQRRRHLHTSVFIALQRMHALSRFSRSMVTDVIVYPGYGDNFLRDIWDEHFTEAIPNYDLFKKMYSQCALDGYKPLVFFKEAGEFRCGFAQTIRGISVDGQSFNVGGVQPEKSGV